MQTKMTGKFWETYQKIVADQVIPYQWRALNDELPDTEPSHAIENFRLAARLAQGEYYGMVFQDSDLYKWLECVAYSLQNQPDVDLEQKADGVIDILRQAQLDDGYLNTYYQVKEGLDKRWTNLRDNHELYCAGHLIEAAVAYYESTGKTTLLTVAQKYADFICRTFGNEADQIPGYPGHEEIELALVRLFLVTADQKYLDQAVYFIDQRGQEPNYFVEEAQAHGRDPKGWWKGSLGYYQAHEPVRKQTEAVGHAVRAMYLYTAVADVARLKDDAGLKETVKMLWHNVVAHKMSVNGGVGAEAFGEAFAENDDLPNDTCYNETCASVGLAFWAQRMLQLEENGAYADVLENAVYNGALGGMDLAGQHFLYVNPLEINGANACARHDHGHVTTQRQKWFACACCPPNLGRLIGSIGAAFVHTNEEVIYVDLYGQSQTQVNFHGQTVTLTQTTDYPFAGDIKLQVEASQAVAATLALRIPAWAATNEIRINEQVLPIQNGYVKLTQTWENETLNFTLPMNLRKIYANTRVTEDIGKVAVAYGPLIYVAEEVDNGKELGALWLTDAPLQVKQTSELLPNAIYLTGTCQRLVTNPATYSIQPPHFETQPLQLVPYFMWGNRGYGEMRVWLQQKF